MKTKTPTHYRSGFQYKPDGRSQARLSISEVWIAPVIAIPALPVFALVLPRDLRVAILMLVLKFAMQVAVLPAAQTLLVRFLVLLV